MSSNGNNKEWEDGKIIHRFVHDGQDGFREAQSKGAWDVAYVHSPCLDGAMARLLTNASGACGRFLPFDYRAETSPFNKIDYQGKRVLLLDICPKVEWLTPLVEAAQTVFVLDHHPTAEAICLALANRFGPSRFQFYLDLTEAKSAAALAYDLFCQHDMSLPASSTSSMLEKDCPVSVTVSADACSKRFACTLSYPNMLRIVNANDTGNFHALSDDDEYVHNALGDMLVDRPLDMPQYQCIEFEHTKMCEIGKVLREPWDAKVQTFLPSLVVQPYTVDGKTYKVAYVRVDSAKFSNSVAKIVFRDPKTKDVDFLACHSHPSFLSPPRTNFSLRRPAHSRVDLAGFARRVANGGGHKGAAGIDVPGSISCLPPAQPLSL